MKLPMIGEPVPEVLQRPRCGNCGKRLSPVIVTHFATKQAARMQYRREEVEPGVFRMVAQPTGEIDNVPGEPVSREWRGQWHGYGAFCTLRCAERFANSAYRSGYRVTKGGARSHR